MLKKLLICLSLLLLSSSAKAHDTWIEAGPLVQHVGEYTYVHLMLGNHGNEHRDFKLASKITLAPCTLTVLAPRGTSLDLKPSIVDMGYAEKEGYWTARCELPEAGVYQFLHTLDTLHGTIRAIKSSKTYVIATDANTPPQIASDATYSPSHQLASDDQPLGLELLLKSPLSSLAAGSEIQMQVLRSGKALSDARVSFVPRGVTLAEGFDPEHERTSDPQGMVRYTPSAGNMLLAVVHHVAPEESGPNYERTHYAATLVLPVRNQPVLANTN